MPVPYFIASGRPEVGYRPSDRQLALWALTAWQETIGRGFVLESGPESDALIRLYWAEPNESQYGEMRPLTVRGRRGAAVYIRPDVNALGPDIARRTATDALFRDSIGRTDLPGGDGKQILRSIENKLMQLPERTDVVCGHGPGTTIGREKERNPFLQGF